MLKIKSSTLSNQPPNINDKKNNWSSCVGMIANLVTILSLPAIGIGLFLNYIQLEDIYLQPDIYLQLSNSKYPIYEVRNQTQKIAEEVVFSPGIFDLSTEKPIPIQVKNLGYINKNSGVGGSSLLEKYYKNNNKYFGIIYLDCKNIRKEKKYWVFINTGRGTPSFYAEMTELNPSIDFDQIKFSTDSYLDSLISNNRRIYIKP